MKSLIFLLFTFLTGLYHSAAVAQERIEVSEQTLRLSSKSQESLYFGFAAGDQIVLNFEELSGKTITSIEIIEYPDVVKFKDYDVKSIRDKIIRVNKKSVYQFRLVNDALFNSKLCKIKIERIPASDGTVHFNTGIRWIDVFDTTYQYRTEVITVYKTDRLEPNRVLYSTDTTIVTLANRIERVRAGARQAAQIAFRIPANVYEPSIEKPMESVEVLSWAYTLASGESGQAWYQDANKKALARAAAQVATQIGLISGVYGALALLALEGVSAFSNPPRGENFKFQFFREQQPLAEHAGNSVAVFGRETLWKEGDYLLRIENDNYLESINVDIKVIALVVRKKWREEMPAQMTPPVPVQEKQVVKIPQISKRSIPVHWQD